MTETMCAEPITIAREGSVAVVTLHRPDSGNAIDLAMSSALLHAAIKCDQDETVRAVLLRSEGRHFCVGGDIRSFAEAGPKVPALLSEETAYLHAAVARFLRMEKPVVTAVNGAAAGAGVSLAILGDIVFASDRSQFSLAYTAIGLSPDGGASWLLPRLVGLRRAQQLILSNARLDAREALEMGLVSQIVDHEALADKALEQAAQLAAGPTAAYGRVRELLLSAYGQTIETHLELEARFIVGNAASPHGQEGIKAFHEKRTPDFSCPLDWRADDMRS